VGLGDGLPRGRQELSGRTSIDATDAAKREDQNKVIVMPLLAHIRLLTFVLSLLCLAAAPVSAQKLGPDGAPNPDASVVNQRTLLEQAPRIQGRIDIPDVKASVLIQPAGRTWDYFHGVLLRWGGAIVILGMIALLALAYLIVGRIRIAAGRSGQKIIRFKAFERFSHWLTAASFVVLGLTGLNITFGKIVLLPIVGPELFSEISQIAKYLHNFSSFAFVAGLILIAVIFFRDNLPARVDLEWIKQGGGFIKSRHAPAGRFNPGEKMVYWLSILAGVAVSASGFILLFPFYGTDIADMQLAQVAHAVIAVLFIALILAHIYIGTLGMEGAFEAMGTGEVDLNWAREHHDRWLAEQLKEGRRPTATPAE
jgi:formate dehydrogenase subunit gamma